MNSSSSDLMSYSSWAKKKKTSFKETVGALFSSFFRFYTLYFGYICYVRDALTQELVRREQIKLAKRWAQGSLTWLNFIPVGLNNGTCIDTGKHKLDNKTLDPKNKIIEKIIYISWKQVQASCEAQTNYTVIKVYCGLTLSLSLVACKFSLKRLLPTDEFRTPSGRTLPTKTISRPLMPFTVTILPRPRRP